MKTSMIILSVMVTLSLAFSLAALVLVAQNSGIFTPNPPTSTATPPPLFQTTPPPTYKPTTPTANPTPTAQNNELTISYTETNRQDLGNDRAKITLTVNIQFHGNTDMALKYSEFYLQLYVPRMIYYLYEGTVNPQNSGTLILGPSHQTGTLSLIFEYHTAGFNGMDPTGVFYQLQYNGSAAVHWTNQDYYH